VLSENAQRFANPITGKLELSAILDGLLQDGLIEGPLERIAASGWVSAANPEQKVDLDFLTRWLAKKVDLPWKRIDPLNMDVAAVTAVASHAYATRFNVICIEAVRDYVVFGTAEPFATEWQQELSRVLQKEIRLVI